MRCLFGLLLLTPLAPTGWAQSFQWNVQLPTSFAPVPYSQDFDSLGGILPPSMAVTGIDPSSGLSDSQAWMNLGQQGPMTIPSASGSTHLELGLSPASVFSYRVRSSLVIGLNGQGLGNLNLDLQVNDLGTVWDPADGIWVSENGTDWYAVMWGWTLPGDHGVWGFHRELFLDRTPINTLGNFYLMFTNESMFPFGNFSGLALDSLLVDDQDYPIFTSIYLAGGNMSTLGLSNFTPNTDVLIGYSTTGAGPTSTPYGVVAMSPPIQLLGVAHTSILGTGDFSFALPARASGHTLYAQVYDPASGKLSNPLAEVIL